jgi:preprotein translocase subunit YajC
LKNQVLKSGLVTGLLGALLLAAGCAAPAAGGDQTGGGFDYTTIILLVVMVGAFYFFLIRPQQKRQKQQREMLEDIKEGDKLITSGGIFGEVVSVDSDTMIVRVESGATMRMLKTAVMVKRETEEPADAVPAEEETPKDNKKKK